MASPSLPAVPSRGSRSTGDIVCAGGMLALGLFVVLYGLRYPMFSDGVVGPGLMPAITGCGLAVAAAVLFWKAWWPAAPAAAEPATAVPEGENLSLADFSEDEPEAVGKPATVAGILVMLVLAVLLAPVFGLVPMMGVLVFVCLFVFERQKLWLSLVLAAGIAAVSWLLFVRLFEIAMPTGSVWQLLGQ
ncbi:MAG: tripartite tricarboxylate transporter TctB family protein [Pseudomonadota bacterium]